MHRERSTYAEWITTLEGYDPQIAEAVNTFRALLKVYDELGHISHKIGGRRRRAKESGSDQNWFPDENRKLLRNHVDPLLDELNRFQATGSYVGDAPFQVLQATKLYLEQAKLDYGLPDRKTDAQLVDEFLQPIFETLRTAIPRDEWIGVFGSPSDLTDVRALVRLVFEPSPNGQANAAVDALESDFMQIRLSEQFRSGKVTGITARLQFASFRDARIRDIYQAVDLVERRLAAKRERKRKEKRKVYFCEFFCGELTESTFHRQSGGTEEGSEHFCRDHASANRRATLVSKPKFRNTVTNLYSSILAHAYEDQAYALRLLGGVDDKHRADVLEHIRSCKDCRGDFHQAERDEFGYCGLEDYESDEGESVCFEPRCLDPEKSYLPSLMAYHASARKLAFEIARSPYCYDGRAWLIDDFAQEGDDIKALADYDLFGNEQAIRKHSGPAFARLRWQNVQRSEISRRMGITPSAVTQRAEKMRGSFDFSRPQELAWLPPRETLGWDWPYAASRYRKLPTLADS